MSDSTQSFHSLFFCVRAGQSLASAPLLSGWFDVVTGLERQGYTVSLFCHLPPLALTGPNTCIQTPTAQPINHCLLIQYKRKFGPDIISVGSHLFLVQSFSVTGCVTWKDRYASGLNCDENCDVLRFIYGLSSNQNDLDLCVSSLMAFHSQIAGSHLCQMCPHNYSHYTLTQSLFTMTFCHITLRVKWHVIFCLQNITSLENHSIDACSPRVHVSSSKSPPLILDNVLSMQTVRPHITNSLNQLHNICSDKLTELQNDLTLFYMTMYLWLIVGPNSLCGGFTFRLRHFASLWSCFVPLYC